MIIRTLTVISTVILSLLFNACSRDNDKALFRIRTGDEIGIDFQNTIPVNDTLNPLTFEYIYNGSGVGVGDFNNDGLQDLFFGGNHASSRLYLNKGKLKFEDATEAAGLKTIQWITGVSVVDINEDGRDDLYLSVAGLTGDNRRNLLFVNQGSENNIPTFVESAKSYGLDDESYSTMAAFFDYDKDGDLDMYLVNNWLEKFNRNNIRPKRVKGEAESTDKLYRNNGDDTFTDISAEAGILIEGYGLGVAICDINQDNWPDVYVANDFMSNDLLWINQHDGTFKNMIGDYIKHQAHNGMGVDVADFNNDALSDIVVVDMLPPGHKRQKLMTPGQNYDHFHMALGLGYEPQYMRNTLQLNRGKMPDGRILFSEIAFAAGVAQTDWSWTPLFADFDNDGLKDLFVSNGYRRDVTNLDFIFFGMEGNPFGTPEARRKKLYEKLNEVEDVKLTNYIYRNNGSLTFEDKTKEWGVELLTFSNGTAYADLDNDGDLDIVTNNIDQEVIVYENQLNRKEPKNNYLRLINKDVASFNEKVYVYTKGKSQFFEHTPYRGFQSTVENFIHVGLGNATLVDSVVITWPDLTKVKYVNVEANNVLQYSKKDGTITSTNAERSAPIFEAAPPVPYVHQEESPSDIKTTRTLIHELGSFGPCISKGDVNGDSLDDFLIGEERGISPRIFIQQKDGSFNASDLKLENAGETGDALFFDADNDGDQDLYLAFCAPSGQEDAAAHVLYTNDGRGNFSITEGAIPLITTSASCVEGGDYDGDGDTDLYVGGRISTREYPLTPQSFILKNEKGKFIDVTAQLNPTLSKPGMISSAVWADINNDNKIDLITAGEWDPVRIFINKGSQFKEGTKEFGLSNSNGWWNCIIPVDLNNDGYMDIAAGNLGKNSFFKPTQEYPVQIWAKDFDHNGSTDPVITYYNPVEKDWFGVHNRLVLIDQIPMVKKRFETFTQYATTPFNKIFSVEELEGAHVANAYKSESAILINKNGKSFEIRDLPDIAQISTVNDIEASDINNDGKMDLIIVGNMYAQETLFGRYDASIGAVLLGDGNFNFKELTPQQSGIVADGDVRYIESLSTTSGKMYVITRNNDSLLFFKKGRNSK